MLLGEMFGCLLVKCKLIVIVSPLDIEGGNFFQLIILFV